MNKVLADILDRPVPKGLSVPKIQILIKEVAMLDTNSKLVYSANGEKIIKELDKYGVKDIPQNYRGVLLEHWLELLSQNQETVTEVPRPTRPEATTLTSDQLTDLGESAEKRAQQKATIQAREKEAVARFKETGEKRYQDQQREEALKEKQTQGLLNQFFKNVGNKVVVVPVGEIPEVQLTKESKEILLATEIAAKEDPATTQKVFEEKIQLALNNSEQEYKESIKEEEIKKSATHLVETLRNLPDHKSVEEIPDKPKSLNNLSIVNPLSDPNNLEMVAMIPYKESREEFAKKVQTLMLTLEKERIVNIAGARAIFGEGGEGLVYSLYGPDTITDFKISSDKNDRDQGVEIDPQAVYEKGRQVYDFINKIKQTEATEEITSTAFAYYPSYTYSGASVATKTVSTLNKALPTIGAVYGFRQGTLLAHWANYGTPLLSSGNQNLVRLLTSQAGIQDIASSSMITFSQPVGFRLGNFAIAVRTGSNTSTGIQIAQGGVRFGEKMLGVSAVKGGSQVAINVGAQQVGAQATSKLLVGASSVLTKTLTFLGGLSAPVTSGIGLVVGYIGGKIVEKLPQIKKWFQENGWVFAVGAGAGGALLFGAGAGIGIGILVGGATIGFRPLATGVFSVLGLIGRSTLITISTPVIVTLLVLPPLVAFIMLVINNSAYIVPPSFESSSSGGYTPSDCLGDPPEKPIATNIHYSSNGKYAYPVAPFPGNPYGGTSCWHWDGNKSADLFSPEKHPPLVAYESGTIVNVTLNDEKGGKYTIIKGESGRHYYYAHMCHVFVKSGEKVKVGDVVGTMDETGSGRVQHLHYSINEPPLSDTFIGGDGNVCPFIDFEEKFNFGICKINTACVRP